MLRGKRNAKLTPTASAVDAVGKRATKRLGATPQR